MPLKGLREYLRDMKLPAQPAAEIQPDEHLGEVREMLRANAQLTPADIQRALRVGYLRAFNLLEAARK